MARVTIKGAVHKGRRTMFAARTLRNS